MKTISESEVFDMPVGSYHLESGDSVSVVETTRYVNSDPIRRKIITFYKGDSLIVYRKKGPAIIAMNVKKDKK